MLAISACANAGRISKVSAPELRGAMRPMPKENIGAEAGVVDDPECLKEEASQRKEASLMAFAQRNPGGRCKGPSSSVH